MDTVGIEAVEIPFILETYPTKKTLVQECCFCTKLKCSRLQQNKFVKDLTIFNIIHGFAGSMGQMTHQPSV